MANKTIVMVRFIKGTVLTGNHEYQIVEKMADNPWNPLPASNDQYMKEVAQRAKLWDGKGIKYKNETEFLQELMRINLLVEYERWVK